jgi:hypothetical protein
LLTNLLSDAEKYGPHSVRCVRIERKEAHELNKREKKDIPEDTLMAKKRGPLTWIAVTGCVFSIIIFAIAVWRRDGMAMLADVLLSSLSTIVGLATKWKLVLQKRRNKTPHTPPGDVVIRYLKGTFLIVQCDEEVARELYFAPEDMDYLIKSSWQYRIISLLGTVMLMFGVIFLANAQTQLQLAFGGAYIIMNALYWVVAALPSRVHWDTSCFKVIEQCIELKASVTDKTLDDSAVAARVLPKPVGKTMKTFVDQNDSFTQALWKAIVITKDVEWIRKSAAAPNTPAWDEWLVKAQARARSTGEPGNRWEKIDGRDILVWDLPDWEPGKALNECLMKHKSLRETFITEPPPPPLASNTKEDAGPGAEKLV